VYFQSTTATIQKSLLDVGVDEIIVGRGVDDSLAPDARQQRNATDSLKSTMEINLRGMSNNNDTHGDRGGKASRTEAAIKVQNYHTGVVSFANKNLWETPKEALEVFLSVISSCVHSPPKTKKQRTRT
jgi:hypothetical protein